MGGDANEFGTALARLGERDHKLEEAVAAYREALKEWTRERVPLDCARTQMNLGTALETLGERHPDDLAWVEAEIGRLFRERRAFP